MLFPKFMSLEVQCLRLKVYDTYIAADIESNSFLLKIYVKYLYSCIRQ